ncbi:SPFH domain-containing protein [Planctomicrobium piriforme]|uniref:Regulator of protease activity HflC, stomatin/prohibitin superfamily n=1 Tax=Planctomicrobium piriforme TaxID=1576369 RepID=A0A1I3FYM9_9PLAN|nr:SPFH domain-containing protein [Planctomicrobium piriforme]SFI16011.1 Regulator of protease activity HflC, stomatin/prohibitin superfamily [Planctomicrobium piriforme]
MSTQQHDGLKGSNLERLVVWGVSIFFPPILLAGFVVLGPREEIVVLRFGKYVKTLKQQGICWIHPVGRRLHRISTQDNTLEIHGTTVVEKNGNPIQISAVVVYRVEDTYRAALDVQNYRNFLSDQAGAVVKRVASRFPYESSDEHIPCLKKESDAVQHEFVTDLQDAVNPSGIRVLNVRLNDLTYAPEIAQSMLMRQQAMALIDARKTIVEGAVEIVQDAVRRLQAANLEVAADQRDQLVSNLLVVLCSGERAQPVLAVQSSSRQRA